MKGTVRSSKIIGGILATAGQFPWQAGLYLDGSGFCGGSLISSNVVLTAGHCVDGYFLFVVVVLVTTVFW
jgi:secreted trypsin-like serine protease